MRYGWLEVVGGKGDVGGTIRWERPYGCFWGLRVRRAVGTIRQYRWEAFVGMVGWVGCVRLNVHAPACPPPPPLQSQLLSTFRSPPFPNPPDRFAGAVAKRLASLGALLQGDQRALGAAANLRSYDIETDYARSALVRTYDDICNNEAPMPGVRVRACMLAWGCGLAWMLACMRVSACMGVWACVDACLHAGV